MSEASPSTESRLVPGRTCGACNVCCVVLTIDEKDLQKLQGYKCRHTLPDKGCRIYESRPQTCRSYYCGWRLLKWIREPLRPDLSGVLVRLQYEQPNGTEPPRQGVVFTLLNRAALKADGLAESVAAAVAADVPVWLQIPGPPGYTSSQARINDVLRQAVITMDKKAVLDILRQARIKGLSGKHVPIVFSSETKTDRPRAGP